MAEELIYKKQAAAGYHRGFAHVMTHFGPFLLRAARLAPGMRVLNIAAGTGFAAEAALGVVGSTGHVRARRPLACDGREGGPARQSATTEPDVYERESSDATGETERGNA